MINRPRFSRLVLALVAGLASSLQAQTQPLWQIGLPDGKNDEFALAPSSSAKFTQDGFFVVGKSDSKTDWPYVQPGPNDAWAGAHPHTFTIVFGLKAKPAAGPCQLQLRLLDTHSGGPPKLKVLINGQEFERALPAGGSDGSIQGKLDKGRPCTVEVGFDAQLLNLGDNDIQISTVSGCWMLYDSLALTTPAGAVLDEVKCQTVLGKAQPVPALREENGAALQPVLVTVRHRGEPQQASLSVEGAAPQALTLQPGEQSVELSVPAVKEPTRRQLQLQLQGRTVASRTVEFKPIRPLTVYILPHSHTDIGYTAIQSSIETKQVNNLLEGIAAAKRTASYPEGARFVWNVEVLWAADLYLHRLDATQRADFFEAVKKGQVVLNGMYLNELTGLCRPEELVRLFQYSTQLAQQTGVPIDSAMISDVPGYTWGTVSAMNQAGIKYFSTAPNYFDRIGSILRDWENKPFYWVGPDGHSKVLVWIPFWGYAMSHVYHTMSLKLVDEFCAGLEKRSYPYEIAYVRWSGHGDNAVPDPAICEFVKDWNAKYTSPHFIISGTSQAFHAFEQRYGKQLPLVRGDWTPYWEDGAGSSALQTAQNRASSERLVQAETLFAMYKPTGYPKTEFEAAWDKVLLYSEHTWGAWCSISEPERKETQEQWVVKKSYADEADEQSRHLLQQGLQLGGSVPSAADSFEVINTLSWPRTELVSVPAALAGAAKRVLDERGRPLPSQRLASGELAFLAKEAPPLSERRYKLDSATPAASNGASAHDNILENGLIRVVVDEKSGGIVELTLKGLKGNFADTSKGDALNDYVYFKGEELKNLQGSGPVQIHVGEPGPLVASLIIESEAPGCTHLRRELRVVAGQDYVELLNLVDKARLQAKSYHAREGKESLNFAFPFHVPEGELLLDIPLGAMHPDADQMLSACKNWLTVGRWVELANAQEGITWVTLDAPLIQVGELSARLLNSQTNPDVWRSKIGRSQRLYSWAMNNHWGTNYRAYQEGPTLFRFILRPHRKGAEPAQASRFATGFSQPLLVRPTGAKGASTPLLTLSSKDVLVSALKPTQDGKGWIVRLFGASGQSTSTRLDWGQQTPKRLFLSDTSEQAGAPLQGRVTVPGYGLVTLRAEF